MGDRARLFDATADNECVLRVHVVPGAGTDAVAGTHGEALKIRLKAPARAGAANLALVSFLAGALDVPKAQVRLVSGAGSRSKRLRVAMAPASMRAALDSLLEQ